VRMTALARVASVGLWVSMPAFMICDICKIAQRHRGALRDLTRTHPCAKPGPSTLPAPRFWPQCPPSISAISQLELRAGAY